MEKPIWHYTVGLKIDSIIDSGVILLSTAGISESEKPAVWFSINPFWEQTVNKLWRDDSTGTLHQLSKKETMVKGGGLFRIAVEPEVAPYTWRDFVKLSGISKRNAKHMLRVAKERGSNPTEWRASFTPVPMQNWIGVEGWNAELKIWESVGEEITDELSTGIGITGVVGQSSVIVLPDWVPTTDMGFAPRREQ